SGGQFATPQSPSPRGAFIISMNFMVSAPLGALIGAFMGVSEPALRSRHTRRNFFADNLSEVRAVVDNAGAAGRRPRGESRNRVLCTLCTRFDRLRVAMSSAASDFDAELAALRAAVSSGDRSGAAKHLRAIDTALAGISSPVVRGLAYARVQAEIGHADV